MNAPDLECLISEVIANRPKVSTAPMNLYIFEGRLCCGARAVMPSNANFVAHLLPQQLECGFNDSDWRLIIEKTMKTVGMGRLIPTDAKKPLHVLQEEFRDQIEASRPKLNDRRTERRLAYRKPIWFTENINETHSQGQMLDISSGGVLFTCCSEEKTLRPNQFITARFSVPRLGPDDTVETIHMDRTGRVCRVDKTNEFLHKIAVQFAKPLPFKPAEQGITELDIKQKTGTAKT